MFATPLVAFFLALPTAFAMPQGNAPPTPPQPSCPSQAQIHPNGVYNKCLDVQGAVFQNGTPVQIYDCNGSSAQDWDFSRGSTKVRVRGTNFCLDAGSSPGNGVHMKIWTCYNDVPAQQWFYTDDSRIALQGQGQCLDLSGGSLSNGNFVQTWQCGNSNTNQIWV